MRRLGRKPLLIDRHWLSIRDAICSFAADAVADTADKKAGPPLSDVSDTISHPGVVQEIQRRLVAFVIEFWEALLASLPPTASQEATLLSAAMSSDHLAIFSIRSVRCAYCLQGASPRQSIRHWMASPCTGLVFRTA